MTVLLHFGQTSLFTVLGVPETAISPKVLIPKNKEMIHESYP